jgi:ATP-dependent helicase HrpB
MVAMSDLPIAAIKGAFLEAIARGPVVVSSPTGSGKSTEIPRWCEGRVLVVEPRRIACRSLAARVADLEGARLGDAVGYLVRDEPMASASTRIVFATPGVVLRRPDLIEGARTVILDEFHERSLDVDLLFALLLRRRVSGADARFAVMSATLDGARIAAHVGGEHLVAEGRAYPVDVRYLETGDALPDARELTSRVGRALEAAKGDPGDVLVFLPGKAEIEACRDALRGGRDTVIPLHGGLTLAEQRRAFDPAATRKIILATNVAETSLTIPGIGVVIDAGLVRQTRYHDGRGTLALSAIADDSAAQRTGRAGRTAPGVCHRLWSRSARLAPSTPPEIHRESLVPLVMAAAAWRARVEDLPLLDPAKPYALEAARADLGAWGALDAAGAITEGGRALFALPIEPQHARLLVEARKTGCLDDAVDLVAALAVGRPLFLAGAAPDDPHDDLRIAGCDATALVRAVRIGRPDLHRLSGFALDEARRIRARLRRELGLPESPAERTKSAERAVDAEALARTAIAADPRLVHVARPRGRDLYFSNGGTERELARESAVRNAKDVQALVVYDTRAFGVGKETRVLVTCASPLPLGAIARCGLGRDRLGAVSYEHGRVLAKVERVYAKRVVATREEVPRGEVARAALAELFLRGSILKGTLPVARERLARLRLAAKLAERGHPAGLASAAPIPPLEEWVLARLEAVGVESGEDLALLSAADLSPPEIPFELRDALDRAFPATIDVGDASYEADYDLGLRQVTLRTRKGSRTSPPPLAYLPRFEGLRICLDGPRGVTVLRERG